MRLTLNWLDAPDSDRKYFPDYVVIQDKLFDHERVVIDNHQYARCSFQHCTLVYSGGPFGFYDCELDSYSEAALTGDARRVMAFLEALEDRPSAFPGM